MNSADPQNASTPTRQGERCLQAEHPALTQPAVFQRIGGGRGRLIGLGRFRNGEAAPFDRRAQRVGVSLAKRVKNKGLAGSQVHRRVQHTGNFGQAALDATGARRAVHALDLQRVFRRRHVITSGLYSGGNIRGLDLRIGVDGERLVRQIDRSLDNAVYFRDGLLDPADTGDAVQARQREGE